jgi:Putative transposase
LEEGKVTFRWKDYAHGNRQRKMTLSSDEFLRRFFLHVLPHGFVWIRFFGFLANRSRANMLPLCRQLLAMPSQEQTPAVPAC